MSDEQVVLADTLRQQAAAARHLGSPLTARLCEHMADDVATGGAAWMLLRPHATAPLNAAYPLRVLGAAHRLALSGEAPALATHLPSTGGDGDADAAWVALRELVADRHPGIVDALAHPPQTNEVARAASLIGGFLVVARDTSLPLRVLEIGSSAGLNLGFDRFRYEQGAEGWGPAGSPLRFSGLWPDGTPPFTARLEVVERRGCDLDPVDLTTEDGRLTLRSYLWADQLERVARLEAAFEATRDLDIVVDRADAPAWLAQHVAEPERGVATVVFHSIMWQYLSDSARALVATTLADAGARATADAPIAWLRLEPDERFTFPELRLTMWPDGAERLLAECSFHLGPVRWVG